MAQHKCGTHGCRELASGRNIFCVACWSKMPMNLKSGVREGTEKGDHSLRAKPTREWMERATRAVKLPTAATGGSPAAVSA